MSLRASIEGNGPAEHLVSTSIQRLYDDALDMCFLKNLISTVSGAKIEVDTQTTLSTEKFVAGYLLKRSCDTVEGSRDPSADVVQKGQYL